MKFETKQVVEGLPMYGRGWAVALAKRAYQSYCEQAGGVSMVSGQALPAWDDVSVQIQACWIASASAVAKLMCHTMSFSLGQFAVQLLEEASQCDAKKSGVHYEAKPEWERGD